MTETDVSRQQNPYPALKALDVMIGTWDLKGPDFSTKDEIQGQSTFEWMEGGFFRDSHPDQRTPVVLQDIGES